MIQRVKQIKKKVMNLKDKGEVDDWTAAERF